MAEPVGNNVGGCPAEMDLGESGTAMDATRSEVASAEAAVHAAISVSLFWSELQA